MKLTCEILKKEFNLSPQFWEGIVPLRLEHFLWEDNGYRPEVQVRVCYSEEKLHLHFRTYEEDPLIRFYKMNDPVYKDSCVEFFFKPMPSTDERYFNFELNAAGTLILGFGTNTNRSRITTINPEIFDIKPKTGCADKDGRSFWEMEFSVPFSFVREYFPAFQAIPGGSFEGNFYKCGDETEFPHYGCWNLVTAKEPNFHRHEDFGKLIFAQ